MYGRNNIFANNSNSNSNNNNSSYRSNSYSYSGRNNEKLGTYRTDYRYEQPPQYLTAIISVWKQNPPLTIASREEVLHLTPTQIRVQDYYLIRNKKLASLHQDKLRDAIRKQCFNEDLMRNGCYNLLPYSNDRPFDIDTVKAIVRKYEANSNNSYSYGSYNNNDNSRNSNSYTNNSASSNNIFNRNSGSGNNSGNNGSNIFQNSNNSNNIFNRNSNNSNNTSNNNNNNNNIFASRNTNSYGNNNIFNNNNNSNNNNNNNNNYNNNNNNSNNIFNNNGSSGNNIFNNNNNNNNSNNNIFNNSNSNNRSIFNNGSSGNNIFNNSNNNNGNIFNNNNRNNNIFNNNMSNNNGGNIFNNNNNNNIFNKGNNSNFNNSGNGGLNSMLPNFFTQLQTYMKNVNDVVHRLNINISPNQTQSRNISENKPSIFAGKEVQEYDYQAQIKNKKKLKNKDEYRTFTEHESDSNNYSDQGEGEQKQSIKGSRLLGSHLKNTYQDYYKNTSSVIYSNKPNQSSKMSNQQRLQGSSQLHMNSVIKRNKGSNNISNSMSGNASQQEQDYNGPCKCWLKLKIYWLDSKKDIKLPADLTITLELQNFHPNNKQWKAALIQKLKQRNGLIRSDASIEFTFYARPQQDCMHYDIVGMISQKIFNLQNYEIKYARMVGNCAEQLQIYNEYGSIEWYDPIDLVGLDFKESQFSIQKNMIILCNDSPLNCKCLVSFNQLPDNISKIIQQDGDIKKAQEKLRKTVHKTSQGYFNLIDIRKNGGQQGWRMQVTRFP